MGDCQRLLKVQVPVHTSLAAHLVPGDVRTSARAAVVCGSGRELAPFARVATLGSAVGYQLRLPLFRLQGGLVRNGEGGGGGSHGQWWLEDGTPGPCGWRWAMAKGPPFSRVSGTWENIAPCG